jgi:predicted DNA-binding transcriptional regulator YafY
MKPRKNLPKTAIPRIYFIDHEIGSGTYPNAPSMAKKYETSLSSINRDIAYMRDMFGAPIEYDFFKKGFYYTKKTFRLSAAFATADDLLALGMAKNLMELYKNTPIHNAALNLLESISAPLHDEKNTEWFKNRIVIPKTASAPVEISTWEGIVVGLQKNRVITFQYQSTDSENLNNQGKISVIKLNNRRVRPYQLLFDRSAWYLFAYDEDRKDMRIFALSRISNVVLAKETFSIPRGFDYRSLEGTSYFGIYTGSKTYRFTIKITGDTRWIKERTWADDQKIEETSDGIKLSFTSNQFEKVLEWILFQGANARPIAPKILAERWEDTIRKMYSIIS